MDGFEGLSYISTGKCPDCTECPESEEDEGFFSWGPCDGCGSDLGGTRYAAHGRDSEGNIVHLDVCEDCLIACN